MRPWRVQRLGRSCAGICLSVLRLGDLLISCGCIELLELPCGLVLVGSGNRAVRNVRHLPGRHLLSGGSIELLQLCHWDLSGKHGRNFVRELCHRDLLAGERRGVLPVFGGHVSAERRWRRDVLELRSRHGPSELGNGRLHRVFRGTLLHRERTSVYFMCGGLLPACGKRHQLLGMCPGTLRCCIRLVRIVSVHGLRTRRVLCGWVTRVHKLRCGDKRGNIGLDRLCDLPRWHLHGFGGFVVRQLCCREISKSCWCQQLPSLCGG